MKICKLHGFIGHSIWDDEDRMWMSWRRPWKCLYTHSNVQNTRRSM